MMDESMVWGVRRKAAHVFCSALMPLLLIFFHLGGVYKSPLKIPHVSLFLVVCTRLYNPLCPSVCRLVHWSRLAFFGVYRRFWGYCSCPTAWLVNFITAPAHPHANRVAVYTALFFDMHVYWTGIFFSKRTGKITLMRLSNMQELID